MILLHASPRSAAALLPLGERLADRFTIFAFDTPGFGWSEPLRIARPDAADFGDALISAFDALDLDCVPVYGSHTGAAIAVAAANHHPERIAALALDGYGMFTPAEQTQYAQFYLMPIRPDWAGTYLASLWSRVKDQFTVFPWHLMGHWARLPRALLDPAAMQNVAVDFLAAGDNYRAAYAAAFRFDGGPEIRALTVPTTVMARSDDLLFDDLDRLGELPANVTVRKLGSDHCEWASAVASALYRGYSGKVPMLPREIARFRTSGLAQSVVRAPGGAIGIASYGRRDEGSCCCQESLAPHAARRRSFALSDATSPSLRSIFLASVLHILLVIWTSERSQKPCSLRFANSTLMISTWLPLAKALPSHAR